MERVKNREKVQNAGNYSSLLASRWWNFILKNLKQNNMKSFKQCEATII